MNNKKSGYPINENLIFASFQGISNGIPEGMARVMLPILETLQNNNLCFKYYVSFVKGYDGSINVCEISNTYRIIIKALNILNHFVLKMPSYKFRFLHERLYDHFLSHRIKQKSKIISTAHLFKSNLKNKKLGGINILYMSNPDEALLYDLLNNEKKVHSINFIDAYTYKKRIDFTIKSTNSYDHIICITSSVFESFSKRIKKNKLSTSYYYIIPNENIFPKIDLNKNKKLTFIYVGHTVWLKGIYYLLLGWEKANLLDSQLLIVGNINETVEYYIKTRFKKLNNVHYIGNTKNTNTLYRSSHVFISPSLLDAHPTTVSEAMYCGLPAIVSEGCGAKALIDEGINGFVVASGNADDLANKMIWFNNNKTLIPNMGRKAIETINELEKGNQSNKVAEHMLAVIESLSKGKN